MTTVMKSTLVLMLSLCMSVNLCAKTITVNGKKIATGRLYELSELLSSSDSSLEQFNSMIQDKSVFIDCYMPNCPPCKKTKPEIEKLAQEYVDILFIAVNTNQFEDIAEHYSIRAAPTCIFLKKGKEIKRNVGQAKKSELKKMLS